MAEVVGKPAGRAGSGREALRQGPKLSGGRPAGPKEVGRPSGRAGNGREALRQGWK